MALSDGENGIIEIDWLEAAIISKAQGMLVVEMMGVEMMCGCGEDLRSLVWIV